MSDLIARGLAKALQKKTSGYIGLLDYEHLRVAISDGYDYAPVLQECIRVLMTTGGGTIICPQGSFRIESTVYTHLDSYGPQDKFSPLAIIGATPIVADLYNSNVKNVTRFIRKSSAGVILGVNYTSTNECVLTSLYRNLTIKNIAFYGAVKSFDTKYTKVAAEVVATDAIEMRNAAITLEDCIFWSLRRGVSQPGTVLGVDNYCDQSTYQRLGFFNIGETGLQLQRPDASTIDKIYGYDQAKTCENLVYARKGEAFTIGRVLNAGKAMHLAQNFKMVNLVGVKAVKIENLYGERIEGLLLNLENDCADIEVNTVGVRQYGKTYIKMRDTRNVQIKNIHAHVEEGKVLGTADTGDYSTYDTISLPYEIDLDVTCYNTRIGSCTFRNGVHANGNFTETTLRTEPRMPKTGKGVFGSDTYILTVFHNGTALTLRVNGVDMSWAEFCGGTPTYNATTGELSFPNSGIFGNTPSVMVSGRKSPTGVINIPIIQANNPPVIRLLTTAFANVALVDISFSMQVQL